MVFVLFDAFFNIDIELLLLAVVFVILLALFMIVLGKSKMFGRSPAVKSFLAFALALFSVYGISMTRIDLESIFYSVGLTGDILYRVILVVLLAFFWISGYTRVRPNPKKKWKKRVWRLYRPLFILGIIITGLGFTPLVYEKGATVTVGLIILGAGFLCYFFRRKKKKVR